MWQVDILPLSASMRGGGVAGLIILILTGSKIHFVFFTVIVLDTLDNGSVKRILLMKYIIHNVEYCTYVKCNN